VGVFAAALDGLETWESAGDQQHVDTRSSSSSSSSGYTRLYLCIHTYKPKCGEEEEEAFPFLRHVVVVVVVVYPREWRSCVISGEEEGSSVVRHDVSPVMLIVGGWEMGRFTLGICVGSSLLHPPPRLLLHAAGLRIGGGQKRVFPLSDPHSFVFRAL
jgi:hypothetical protein